MNMIALNNTALSTATTVEQALTEIEALGLASRHDMANGHASQELASSQQRIIESLPELWTAASQMKSSEAEATFKSAFCRLANSPSLNSYNHFKICPTASNSIDTVATWLAEKQLRTALIEPTFDNLYLILKRRGVQLTSLPEQSIHEPETNSGTGNGAPGFRELLKNVDAVFLVNPNNPTGTVLTKSQFTYIVEWCAVNNKVLVLDNTFRFFVPQTYDMYEILLDSGVTFLTIEDTGKVWPTQEIKASLLFTSSNIIKEIEIIYDEIFLCHSNFALTLLSQFLLDAADRGLDQAVWSAVRERRLKFREVLDNRILGIHRVSLNSTISVEWVMIKSCFANDLELAEFFKQQNLVLLPGRQFYWNSRGAVGNTHFARFALLKPEDEFKSALDVLGQGLRRFAI
jgi:aspartate/methionine/tyrosine aminotransferase